MDKVTVLCPNGHRVNVSVTRHTSLSEVLEDACKKKNFDPRLHVLQHHNKTLDLSLTVYLANLPRNSMLEMVPAEEPRPSIGTESIKICVQVESGGRVIKEFRPEETLADVFAHVNSESKPVQKEGEVPVLIYLRREFVGQEEFSKMTLQRLGLIQGSAVIRLVFRKPESFGQQAGTFVQVEKPEVTSDSTEKKEVQWRPMRKEPDMKANFELTRDAIQHVAPSTVNSTNNASESNETTIKANIEDSPMDTSEVEQIQPQFQEEKPQPEKKKSAEPEPEEEPILNWIGQSVVLFKRESGKSLRIDPASDLDDDFFELTIEDAMKIQADYRRKIREFDSDAPLLTAEMRQTIQEGEKLTRLNRYPKTVVRIQFPDLHVLQGVFLSGQRVSDVESLVRSYLESPDIRFDLIIPPNTKLQSSNTLLDSDCVPSILLRFIPEKFLMDESSFLKPEVLGKLSNTKGAELALKEAGVVRQNAAKDEPAHDDFVASSGGGSGEKRPKLDQVTATEHETSSRPTTTTSSNVPKWFKGTGVKK